jgi:hypothetical protein
MNTSRVPVTRNSGWRAVNAMIVGARVLRLQLSGTPSPRSHHPADRNRGRPTSHRHQSSEVGARWGRCEPVRGAARQPTPAPLPGGRPRSAR